MKAFWLRLRRLTRRQWLVSYELCIACAQIAAAIVLIAIEAVKGGSHETRGLFGLLGAIAALLGASRAAAAFGLWRRRPWARAVAILAELPMLRAFPFGTAVGVFVLIVLVRSAWDTQEPARRPRDLAFGLALFGGLALTFLRPSMLVESVRRHRQQRAMGDIEILAARIDEYASRHGALPDDMAIGELCALVGQHDAPCPRKDAWGNDYLYGLAPDGKGYVLRSLGNDGAPGGPDSALPLGATRDPADDILYGGGRFLAYPRAASDFR